MGLRRRRRRLFAGGGKELKAAVADSVVGGLVTAAKANFPAATGFCNVVNLIYAVVNPFAWSLIPATLFLLSTVFVMKAGKFMPSFLPRAPK